MYVCCQDWVYQKHVHDVTKLKQCLVETWSDFGQTIIPSVDSNFPAFIFVISWKTDFYCAETEGYWTITFEYIANVRTRGIFWDTVYIHSLFEYEEYSWIWRFVYFIH